jgi:hypothetical protein
MTIMSARLASSMWPMPPSGTGAKRSTRHLVPGQRLHGQRRDELASGLGHHHAHLRARLDQQPAQLRGLVRRDAARHAKHDGLAC